MDMTRLTLEWHLRTIAEGTTDEAYTTGTGKHGPIDGRVCDAFNTEIAFDALASDDPVACLDRIAHDPTVRYEKRMDAETLLSTHIMERRAIDVRSNPFYPTTDTEAEDGDDMPKPSMLSDFWTTVTCPDCGEQETLYNWEDDAPECHCGASIPMPARTD